MRLECQDPVKYEDEEKDVATKSVVYDVDARVCQVSSENSAFTTKYPQMV